MALKRLIEKQTIIIDDHKRGDKEVKNWDNPNVDAHIDKKTHTSINGKKQIIRIRVPLNSEREIIIKNAKGEKFNDIPRELDREIKKAFEDTKKRIAFISDIVDVIKNFRTNLTDEKRVQQVLSNISKHFRLTWTEEKIATYTNDVLTLYTQTYKDSEDRHYFMTIDNKKLKIGESHNSQITHQQLIIRN